MKIPRGMIRTKPDFTISEFFVWLLVVAVSVALIPNLFGLAVGMASGFIVVLTTGKIINSYRLKPWAKNLFTRRLRNG